MPDLFKGWDGGLSEDGGGGGVTDHGALTGLEDNDHPQYRLVTEDITDHGNLSGLTDDDHSQYLNETRHDKTERHGLGTIVPHDSAENITYTPAVNTDWDGDIDPGNVDDALDQLAERVDDNEGSIALKANDTDVVHDTGDETIAGVKTFTSFPVTPSSAPTTDYQTANKKYVDDNAGGGVTDHGGLDGLADDDHTQYLNNTRHDTTARHTLGSVVPQDSSKADDNAVVHDTGDETIAGVKTFTSFPVTPSSAPTSDYQVANKKYVDDNGGGGSGGGIALSAIRVYESSDTWSKPSGLHHILVEVQAAGGGGGGVAGGSGWAQSGGGGGGGYAKKFVLAASLGATETVTVGAGGSGGAAGNNNGSSGGNSSFGTHCVANGGGGGDGCPNTTGSNSADGGVGGIGTTGDLKLRGTQGAGGRILNNSVMWVGGIGGHSHLGAGVSGPPLQAEGANAGYVYGGGGSSIFTTTTNRPGGDGADGVVIVYEYTEI